MLGFEDRDIERKKDRGVRERDLVKSEREEKKKRRD